MKHNLASIAKNFDMRADFISAEPYGSGHINDTYAATYSQAGTQVRYIHQRINHLIFKEPLLLMENIERVTSHIRNKLIATGADDINRRTLTLVPTLDGKICYIDPEGNYWRTYLFVENAQTYDEITETKQAYQAAKALGEFQKQLTDLPGPRLHDTIPGFHNTRQRFNNLTKAIETDSHNRAASVKADIEFALKREAMVDILLDLQAKGDIPEIITHSDTKLNNVMLDNKTSEGICVIDLDTVMPGLSLYDFGDMARTAMRPTPEDETDLSKVVAQTDMFKALADGYLSSAGDMLTQAEKDHLAFSTKLITFEIGLRFLTDYLEGDIYFKTHREGHNLDRCHVQFKMVESLESLDDEMNKIIAAI